MNGKCKDRETDAEGEKNNPDNLDKAESFALIVCSVKVSVILENFRLTA